LKRSVTSWFCEITRAKGNSQLLWGTKRLFTFKPGSIRDSDDFLFLKLSDNVEIFGLAGFEVVHGMGVLFASF